MRLPSDEGPSARRSPLRPWPPDYSVCPLRRHIGNCSARAPAAPKDGWRQSYWQTECASTPAREGLCFPRIARSAGGHPWKTPSRGTCTARCVDHHIRDVGKIGLRRASIRGRLVDHTDARRQGGAKRSAFLSPTQRTMRAEMPVESSPPPLWSKARRPTDNSRRPMGRLNRRYFYRRPANRLPTEAGLSYPNHLNPWHYWRPW